MLGEVNNRIRRAERDYNSIRNAIRGIDLTAEQIEAAESAAREAMMSTNAWHKHRFTKAMRRTFGVRVDLLADTPIDLDARIRHNVGLIRTIPGRFHERMSEKLIQMATQAPFDQNRLHRTVTNEFRSVGYNARRITRDQTSKLIGQLNESRQTDLGVTHYEWSTSMDRRVRKSHRDNESEIFAWGKPPVRTGHPGFDINCRCAALAVIPAGPFADPDPEVDWLARRETGDLRPGEDGFVGMAQSKTGVFASDDRVGTAGNKQFRQILRDRWNINHRVLDGVGLTDEARAEILQVLHTMDRYYPDGAAQHRRDRHREPRR